jgi:hypothetical protein
MLRTLVLLAVCVSTAANAHQVFHRGLVAQSCQKQPVVNATCVPSATLAGAAPRFDQVFCSTDLRNIGQVSYADSSCTIPIDSLVVPNDICMVCPTTTPLKSHLPTLDIIASIVTFESTNCAGNTATRNFLPGTCAYDVTTAGVQRQISLTCLDGVGTLSVFNQTDGSCSGAPTEIITRRSHTCVDKVMFMCPTTPSYDFNGARGLDAGCWAWIAILVALAVRAN